MPNESTPLDVSTDRPTSVRYAVLSVSFLAAVLLYLDRFCMSFAQRYVKEDLNLSEFQFGVFVSAFFFSYALAQVPSGWFSDRFGPRKMMCLYILMWSLFTGWMGLIGSFAGMIFVRIMFGLGQAGAYPTCASIVRRWMPFEMRGIGSSAIAVGGRVGGAIAPLLTAILVVAFVPMGTNVTLSESDILDANQVNKLFESHIDPVVMNQRSLGQKLLKLDGKPNPDSEEPALSPAELVSSFNALIDGDLVATNDELTGIALEKEAQRLFEETTLNDEQQARLNRLVLESIYPDVIKKLYVQGWRSVMFVYGLLGIPIALFLWIVVRDTPEQHPRANLAEQQLILGETEIQADQTPDEQPESNPAVNTLPLGKIVTSPGLWLLSISQFGTNVGWVFLVSWLPSYFLRVHQAPFESRAWMATIPLLCGWVGMICGGFLTDRLVVWWGLRWGRAIPIGVSRAAAGLCFFSVALFTPSAAGAVALFAMVGFLTDSGSASFWAVNQDIGGKYTASVLGWGNMWGNFGAGLSPLLVGWLVDGENNNNWNTAFYICGGAFLIAGVCGLFIDSRVPLESSTVLEPEEAV